MPVCDQLSTPPTHKVPAYVFLFHLTCTIQTNFQRTDSPKASAILMSCAIVDLLNIQLSSTYPDFESACVSEENVSEENLK